MKKLFFKYKETFVSCAVLLVIMLIMFATENIWPLGNNTLAEKDLSNQIIPLASLVLDFFEGKASFLYSNRLGGGMNIFGVLAYFIVSPLYLILLLGGRSNMYFMVNIMFVAYFICMVIALNYMMKKLFKLNTALHVVLSLCYCFCAYVLQNSSYIIWLNYMVIVPLMVVAFKDLVEKGKYLSFSWLVFAFIVSCFGVGANLMFVLLAMCYLYIVICVEKGSRKPILVRLGIAILIGVLLSSVIIVPVLLSALKGTRSGQLFDFVFTSSLDRGLSKKLMYIVLDFAFGVLTLVFIAFSNKRDKYNKFLSIVLLGLIFIHIIDASLMLLCFGKNTGYYTRLDFLLLIVSILAICKFWQDIGRTEKDVAIRQRVNRGKMKLECMIAIGVLFCLVFCVVIIKNFDEIRRVAQLVLLHDEEIEDVKAVIPILSMVMIMFAVLFLLFEFKWIRAKTFKVVIVVFVLCQACLGIAMFSCLNYSADFYTVPAKLVAENCNDYDKCTTTLTNGTIYFDSSGISAFTSMLPQKTYDAYSDLGFGTKFNYVNSSSTLLMQSVMGVRYYVGYTYKNEKLYSVVDTKEGKTKDGASIYYFLEEYKYWTTGAFLIDSDYAWDYDLNVFENQNLLARALGANEDVFEIYTLADLLQSESVVNCESEGLNINNGECKTYQDVDGFVRYSLTTPANNVLYMAVEGEGYNLLKYSTLSRKTSKKAIYTTNSGTFRIPKNTSWDLSKVYFAILNYDSFEEAINMIRKNQIEVSYNANGFSANVDNDYEDKMLFVTNVNIDGMKAKLNGKNVEIVDVATGFIGVKLGVGESKIEVYYSSPILLPSVLTSIVCIAIAIFVIVLYNKGKFAWLNKIVGPLYIVYMVCFVGLLYVFTGVLTFVKIISL